MNNKTNGPRGLHNQQVRPFENSWSITYRKPNYDALGDPHASYYFLNKSMKRHLLSLQKSIKKEGAFTEKKKIRYMISQRIKDYDNTNKTKIQAYYFGLKSSPSISSLASGRSRSSLGKQQKTETKIAKKSTNSKSFKHNSKTIVVSSQNQQQRRRKMFQLPKISSNNQEEDKANGQTSNSKAAKLDLSNKEQHNRFLQYIIERKKKLSTEAHLSKIEKEVCLQK